MIRKYVTRQVNFGLFGLGKKKKEKKLPTVQKYPQKTLELMGYEFSAEDDPNENFIKNFPKIKAFVEKSIINQFSKDLSRNEDMQWMDYDDLYNNYDGDIGWGDNSFDIYLEGTVGIEVMGTINPLKIQYISLGNDEDKW